MKDGQDLRAEITKCIEASGIEWKDGLGLASLDVIVLAVKLEKTFGFQFGLDEIDAESFSTIDGICALVSRHLGGGLR